MGNDAQAIFRTLFPALLVFVACGGTTSPDAAAGGAAGAIGAAGAGATGTAGDVGTAGSAGEPATGDAGVTGTAGEPSASELPDGDAGPSEPPSDAGVSSEGGTVLPPYAGGLVNAINATNWNETTIHPFSTRRMLVRDEGDPHLVLLDFGNPTPVVWKNATDGPWGRGIQLIGNNQVLGSRSDGYSVFDLTTGRVVKTVSTFPNTTSAYRMANGETMLTHGGSTQALPADRIITLSFLDKADRVSHTVNYTGFGYVRMTRPTRNKTFLVPSDTTLFEGDAAGNILWTTTGTSWNHIWEPLLMTDGNVLLSTFFGSSLDVVDRDTHLVTRRYGTKTMPMAAMFKPNGFAEFQILPNGNLITSNWQGDGGGNGNSGVQVIEFNPAGEVAWFYKQDPTVFAAIQGVLVLDGMDPNYLHAQEISADSTWQPVIPTP